MALQYASGGQAVFRVHFLYCCKAEKDLKQHIFRYLCSNLDNQYLTNQLCRLISKVSCTKRLTSNK